MVAIVANDYRRHRPIQSGETWKAALLGLGVASLAAFAGWAWWRIKKARSGGKYQDPQLIKEKVSRIAALGSQALLCMLDPNGDPGTVWRPR